MTGRPSVVGFVAEVGRGVVMSVLRNGMTATGAVVAECAMLGARKQTHH